MPAAHLIKITGLCLALCLLVWSGVQQAEGPAARFGLSPVFVDDQVSLLELWSAYLERRLGGKVEFVQRASYGEMTHLLNQGGLDFAWICSNSYLQYQNELSLIAVPVFRGQPLYQSYIIVPADEPEIRLLPDLNNKVFALSDPDSTTGHLVIHQALAEIGTNPDEFFKKYFFTYSHRNVIRAVAEGLAHGGAVDSYVWETLARTEPQVTSRTRIIWKSRPYGISPIVTNHFTTDTLRQRFAQALFDMAKDSQGREILDKLNLNGFVAANPALYRGVQELRSAVIPSSLPSR